MAKTCPKCGYVRQPGDTAPAWQCPSCQIAYHKFAEYTAQMRRLARPPRAGEAPPPAALDGSVWGLVAANLITIVAAVWLSWSLNSLLTVYWVQSVMIGVSYLLRIASLERFSTQNFRMNGHAVEPTRSTKVQVAIFFALHFGFFHVVYFVFVNASLDKAGGSWLNSGFLLCAIVFVATHLWSYRYNRSIDRLGTPNIGNLMFIPYIRVVPMHITIIFGGLLADGAAALILFGLLKTVADVAMHFVEHWQLNKLRGQAAARAAVPKQRDSAPKRFRS